MAKKSNTHSKKRRLRNKGYWLAVVFLLALTALSVTYGAYTFWHQHIEAGQFRVSDTFIGENLRDSLDLKVASKAKFPSAPIKITENLGLAGGIDRRHFSFQVKADNLTEYGLLTLPPIPPPPAGYPTLILLHGFSSPRDYNTDAYYLEDMSFYSRHGFAVFKPDYRGQGLTVNAGHPDSAYYSMVYNTDVMSLISALKQTPLVDKSNISIWGHSMGAYIGLRAAVMSPDIKNVILLSGPVDSLPKMYATYVPPSDAHDPYALATRNDIFAKYHTPNNDEFWSDSSPINLLSRVKADIQINVGLQDGTVPPEFSADLDAALTKAGVRHQYFSYPDGDHSLLPQRELIWSRSLQLLQPGG